MRQGRFDEGLKELLKAQELDPLAPNVAWAVAIPYYLERDYVRALETLRQANKLGPAFTQTWAIGPYIQTRSLDEALAELEKEKAKPERKDDPLLIYDTGMIYAAQGKRTETLQIIKELEAMSGPNVDQAHYIAKIYATLNEKEQALAWLERGFWKNGLSIMKYLAIRTGSVSAREFCKRWIARTQAGMGREIWATRGYRLKL